MSSLRAAILASLLVPSFPSPGLTAAFDSGFQEYIATLIFPAYPEDLRLQGVEGNVVVEVLVSEDGDVVTAQAVGGDARLRPLAEEAAKRWRFRPFSSDGRSVQRKGTIVFRFHKEGRVFVSRTPRGVYVGWPGTELIPEEGRIVASISGEGDTRDSTVKAVVKVSPKYPTMAKDAKVEGAVVVEVQVSDSGRVVSARALSGHPLLRASAEEAALKWRFEPVTVDGAPTESIGIIRFYFTLAKRSERQ